MLAIVAFWAGTIVVNVVSSTFGAYCVSQTHNQEHNLIFGHKYAIGSAIAMLCAFFLGPFWVEWLVVGLMTGIPFGLVLTTLAYFTHRAFMGMAGFMVGGLLAYGIIVMPSGAWQPIEPAPEPIAELMTNISVDSVHTPIVIRATTGQLFSYDCLHHSNPCGWVKLENPPVSAPIEDNYCTGPQVEELTSPYPLTPILFGTITQWIQFRICGPEGTIYTHVVLLSDGSLWTWERINSVYEVIFIFPGAIGAGVVAGVVGMILPFTSRWQRKKATPKKALK
jgi:hypothetical protein